LSGDVVNVDRNIGWCGDEEGDGDRGIERVRIWRGEIVVSGISSGAAADTAVPKSVTDSLDTRLSTLEKGGTFSVDPGVWVNLRAVTWGVQAEFGLEKPAEETNLQRYVLLYSRKILGESLSPGSITEAEFEALAKEADGTGQVYSGQLPNTRNFYSQNDGLHVAVVAIDADSPPNYYLSGIKYAQPIPPLEAYSRTADGGALVIYNTRSLVFVEQGTIPGAAPNFIEWLETTTNPIVKCRLPYSYNGRDKLLRLSYFGKVDAAVDPGYIEIAIWLPNGAAGTPEISATNVMKNLTYGLSPSTLDLDVSGLTTGDIYDIEVSIWSSVAAAKTKVMSNLVFDIQSETPII